MSEAFYKHVTPEGVYEGPEIWTGDVFLGPTRKTRVIKSLGTLRMCRGDISAVSSLLESLGDLEHVTGDIELNYSKVKDLGKLRIVGEDLDICDTTLSSSSCLVNIESIGKVLYTDWRAIPFLPKVGTASTLDIGYYREGYHVKRYNTFVKYIKDLDPMSLVERRNKEPMFKELIDARLGGLLK